MWAESWRFFCVLCDIFVASNYVFPVGQLPLPRLWRRSYGVVVW